MHHTNKSESRKGYRPIMSNSI